MSLKERLLKWAEPFLRLGTAGLDISDRSVKCLAFREDKTGVGIESWGEAEIPEGVIVNGEIKDESTLTKILQSGLGEAGKSIRRKFIAVSLPEEKSFHRMIQIPKVKKEEVEAAIRWEIESNIPLSPKEINYDYEMVEPPEKYFDHLDVVITAFPKSIIESYIRALGNAGLKLAACELEHQAIIRAAVPEPSSERARILVDLGRFRSGIVIFAGGAITFTATANLGGINFEENIAKALGVNPEKAEEIKKTVGLNKKERAGEIFSILIPAVSVLLDEIKLAIDYHQRRTAHIHGTAKPIDEILLTGGDANLLGLDTYLSGSLKIPVRIADPWAGLRNKLNPRIPPIPKNRALGFTTAIGLAMRGTS